MPFRAFGPECGYFLRSIRSSPSSAILARTGLTGPPCGVPSSVGWRTDLSMYPAFSHVLRMVLSIGTWRSNHGWLILSQQDLMSPSSIHCGLVLFESTVAHCSIASAQLRSFRNPYEFGSASVSAMGSRACRYKACMALSGMVGIPTVHYIYIPAVFGIGDHHPSPSSPLGPAM